MPRYLALLRAVNVGGRKVEMAKLRSALEALGLENVRTLLASGNVVFETRTTPAAKLESAIEHAIASAFGLRSDVMVRTPRQWSAMIKANPFPDKAKADPAHLVVGVGKKKPDAAALDAYLKTFREKHDKGERVKIVGRDIFIDYGASIGRSKLVIPAKVGVGTSRNWNTALKIDEMLNE